MKLIIAAGPTASGKSTVARDRYQEEMARIASEYTPEQQAGVDPPDEVVVLLSSWGDLDVALRSDSLKNAIVILDTEGDVPLESVELLKPYEATDSPLPNSTE